MNEELRVKLVRHWSDLNQSTGTLLIVNKENQPIFGSLCIERGDRNNQRNVSRVPSGVYDLIWEWSPKFKRNLWEIKGVPGRSECKIHPANFWDQLNGCIAPGIRLKDFDKDGYYDVTYSARTTNMFNSVLKNLSKTTIEIIDEI